MTVKSRLAKLNRRAGDPKRPNDYVMLIQRDDGLYTDSRGGLVATYERHRANYGARCLMLVLDLI